MTAIAKKVVITGIDPFVTKARIRADTVPTNRNMTDAINCDFKSISSRAKMTHNARRLHDMALNVPSKCADSHLI
jgi:hypothetical protein